MISVIVPVYNAEKLLDKCVGSILDQTYRDFELYLVDDGSTDNSGILCDEYAAKDSRIKVIHGENSCAAMAREKAMGKCSGDYICFVDADDYIAKDMLEHLYDDLTREDADIACCRALQIDKDKKCIADNFSEYEVVTGKERYIDDFLGNSNMYNKVVWGKLYKRDVLNGVHFMHLVFGEDTLYMYEVFKKSGKVVLDPYVGYFYIRNSDSVTKREMNEEKEAVIALDHIFSLKALSDLGKDLDFEYAKKANAKYAESIFAAISRMIKCGNRDLYKSRYDYICGHISNLRELKGIPTKTKLILFLYRYLPGLFWYLFSIIISLRH